MTPPIGATVYLTFANPMVFRVRAAIRIALVRSDTAQRTTEVQEHWTSAIHPAAVIHTGEEFSVGVCRIRGEWSSGIAAGPTRCHGNRVVLAAFRRSRLRTVI